MTEQTTLTDFPEGEFYVAAEHGNVERVQDLLSRLPGYPDNMDETHFKIFVKGLTGAAQYGCADVTTEMLAKLDTGDQVLTAVTAGPP